MTKRTITVLVFLVALVLIFLIQKRKEAFFINNGPATELKETTIDNKPNRLQTNKNSYIFRNLLQSQKYMSSREQLLDNDINSSEGDSKKRSEQYWTMAPFFLDEILSEQEKDLKWTSDIEAFATNLFEQDKYIGTELVKVDCRETLCKVVTNHDNEDVFFTFSREATLIGPWATNQHGSRKEILNGEIEAVMYFSLTEADSSPFEDLGERIAEYRNNLY